MDQEGTVYETFFVLRKTNRPKLSLNEILEAFIGQ